MNEVQENIDALQAAIDLAGRYPKHPDIEKLPDSRHQMKTPYRLPLRLLQCLPYKVQCLIMLQNSILFIKTSILFPI